MRWTTAAVLALAGCSTTATQPDIDRTNAGIMFGVEACERQATGGLSMEATLAETARGRSYARHDSAVRGSNLRTPNWKLDGMVWVGLNQQGNCDVVALSGSGLAARDMVVSTHLGMSSRRWMPMQVIPAPAGETRDGLCTVDRMPEGRSLGVVMTSRNDNAVTLERTFVATVVQTDAASCTSRARS
jgi:hypothetical protein